MPVDKRQIFEKLLQLPPEQLDALEQMQSMAVGAQDESTQIIRQARQQAMQIKPGLGDAVIGGLGGLRNVANRFGNRPAQGPNPFVQVLQQRAGDRQMQQQGIMDDAALMAQRPMNQLGAFNDALKMGQGLADDAESKRRFDANLGETHLNNLYKMSETQNERKRQSEKDALDADYTRSRIAANNALADKRGTDAGDTDKSMSDAEQRQRAKERKQTKITKQSGMLGRSMEDADPGYFLGTGKGQVGGDFLGAKPEQLGTLLRERERLTGQNVPSYSSPWYAPWADSTYPGLPDSLGPLSDSLRSTIDAPLDQFYDQSQGGGSGVISRSSLPPDVASLAAKIESGQFTEAEKQQLIKWMRDNGVEEIQ